MIPPGGAESGLKSLLQKIIMSYINEVLKAFPVPLSAQ
jgi:hypothetical protein